METTAYARRLNVFDQIWMMFSCEMSRHFLSLSEFMGADTIRILVANIYNNNMQQGLSPSQNVDEAAQFTLT
jgi:hypothetical protein